MGSVASKSRAISVSNPSRRLSKEELSRLKEAFNRIQEGQVRTSTLTHTLFQVINDYKFHMEVLGPQVPESVAFKIF